MNDEQQTTDDSPLATRYSLLTQHSALSTQHLIWLAGALMGAFGVGGYLFWAISGGLVREGRWIGVDFHVYYQAARVLMRGQDIYTAGISPPYVYPPLLGMLVIPLALLDVDAATIIWKLLQHFCLFVSGALLVSMMPQRVRPLAAGVLLLGLLATPLQDEIQVGESNSFILLLVVGAVWLVSRMGPKEGFTPLALGAGALLTLAASIKVLPVLLIAYFWWRGPRSVAAAATVGFLLLQGLLFLLTPSTADYWFTQFPGLFGQAFPYLDNQSLNSVVARATMNPTDPTAPNTQILNAEAMRPALTWIANLLVLGAAMVVLWLAGRRTTDNGRWTMDDSKQARTIRLLLEVGLVLLTVHLVSGSTWLHHLVDLGIPVLALLGTWWLAQESGIGNRESGIGTLSDTDPRFPIPDSRLPTSSLLYGVGLGLVLAALVNRPADWLYAANVVVSGNSLVALLASSVGALVVIALWVWVAVTLLRFSHMKMQPFSPFSG